MRAYALLALLTLGIAATGVYLLATFVGHVSSQIPS